MKVKYFVFGVAEVLAAITNAAPTVSVSRMTQNQGVVQIDYVLANESAIVTVDFLTNGVSIGESNFVNVGGEVNQLVVPGAHSIRWKPRKSWPNHRAVVKAVVKTWTQANPPDYMVIDLTKANCVNYYVSAEALPAGGLVNDDYRLTKMVFRKINARGERFRMGRSYDESSAKVDTFKEYPMIVSFTRDYYMGVYPVTQKQYMLIQNLEVSPCTFKNNYYGGDEYLMGPVETVSYNVLRGGSWQGSDGSTATRSIDPAVGSLVANIRSLSGISSIDLPTEAQWEFAARAGSSTKYWWGDAAIQTSQGNIKQSVSPARENLQFSYRTTRVDAYPENPWGICDMYGNVEEVCLDWAKAELGREPQLDYCGPGNADCSLKTHVTKGGGCQRTHNDYYRSAWHNEGLNQANEQKRSVAGARLCCTIGQN